MSTRYPGDTEDALFMNDGPPSEWWNSADIWLNTPGGTVANEGANTIHMNLRQVAGKTFSASAAEFEVFVGNPSLVMTPSAGTVNLGSDTVAKALFGAGGGVASAQLPWNVTTTPGAIVGAGHRCLIVRVYPFGSSKPSDFQVPTDQHEAQRNICIVECAESGAAPGGAGGGMAGAPGGEPMGPDEDGLWAFMVDTTTPLLDRAERVTVRATRPIALEAATLRTIRPLLKRTRFRGFAVVPPPKFLLRFEGDEDVEDARGTMVTSVGLLDRLAARLPDVIRDPLVRAPGFGRRKPRLDVHVKLKPKAMARFGLRVDMRKTPRGQAQVFHLQQIGSQQQVQGGLTLVLVKVD